MLSDAELMRRVAGNDGKAVEELLSRFRALVCHLANQARVDADDAVQEVMLRLWRRASTYDATAGSLYTWVATIARHAICDALRGKRRRAWAVPLDVENTSIHPQARPPEPYEPTFERVARHGLARSMETLELHYGRGATLQAIATSKGVPLGTVKSQLSHSLARMRETQS